MSWFLCILYFQLRSMKQCSYVTKVLLIAYIIITAYCSSVPNYKQQLTVTQDNMLSISFYIPQRYLPIPLRSTITDQSKVTINYGPYYHQILHQSYNLSAFNGITTEIQAYDRQYVSPKLKQALQGTFSISLCQRYSYFFQQSNSWIFNDPNDKFCTHHLQQIIRNILPCGTNAGLAQLFDLETMFSAWGYGSRLYGMKVLWNQSIFELKVLLEMDQIILGLKKIKINEKCLQNSQLIMLDASNNTIGLRQLVVNRLDEYKSRKYYNYYQNQIKISRQIVGNWYHSEKDIIITIQSNQVVNYSLIIIRQIIPKRAGVTHIKLINHQENKSNITFTSVCTTQNNFNQPRYKQSSSVCEISIRIVNDLSTQQYQYFSLVIGLSTKMTNFDNYQSIFGGGTQISNIPVTTIYNQGQSIQVKRYFATPASLKTPEPDQSLPFQIITFVLGVIGYLWISIWRKLVYDLKNVNQKHKME